VQADTNANKPITFFALIANSPLRSSTAPPYGARCYFLRWRRKSWARRTFTDNSCDDSLIPILE
jgi:hypothetical protein